MPDTGEFARRSVARRRALLRREGAPDIPGFLDDRRFFTTQLQGLSGLTGTFTADPSDSDSVSVPFVGTLGRVRGEMVPRSTAVVPDLTTYEIEEA